MTTHHTPGEWYQRATSSGQHMIASECKGDTIAVVYNDHEANAQLIASAPELLEALTALLKCTELNMDDMEDETRELIDQAQAVILKATGDKVEAGGQEKQTKAEQYRKTHARMGITSGGWNTERIIKSPDVPKHPSSNALANGWIFNDGSELWETDEGGIWSVYTTPAINK